jgi:hypothetical protein
MSTLPDSMPSQVFFTLLGQQSTNEPSMTKRILLSLLAVSFVLAGTACRSHKKDSITNKPAAEMEASFKQRWVDKRVNELVASGIAADAAREKANREFNAQFEFILNGK